MHFECEFLLFKFQTFTWFHPRFMLFHMAMVVLNIFGLLRCTLVLANQVLEHFATQTHTTETAIKLVQMGGGGGCGKWSGTGFGKMSIVMDNIWYIKADVSKVEKVNPASFVKVCVCVCVVTRTGLLAMIHSGMPVLCIRGNEQPMRNLLRLAISPLRDRPVQRAKRVLYSNGY